MIRAAINPADLAEVAAIQASLFDDNMPDVDQGYWWLVTCDGAPAAFAGLEQSKYFHKTGFLCSAGVLWEHRGQGIQKRLIRIRVAKARRLGWEWVVSNTNPKNHASSNSLIRCGFKLFKPWWPWAYRGSLYWGRRL